MSSGNCSGIGIGIGVEKSSLEEIGDWNGDGGTGGKEYR